MKRYYLFFILPVIVFSILLLPGVIGAQIDELFIRFDQATIIKGYTAEYNNKDFRLAITPNLIDEEITLNMKQFSGDGLPVPEGFRLISEYYIFDILRQDRENKSPLIFNQPIILALRFDSDTYFNKRIHFWDKNKQNWIPLPSSIDYAGRYVRAYTHLPFSRIAVFEDQTGLVGKASWYRSSKYQYGAACNNYPLGTKLRVRNLDNNKTVEVEVVSTGPFDPDRVIDLTLPAFEQIEKRWKGLARVQVEPISGEVKVLGVDTSLPPAPVQPAALKPQLQSKAVVAIKVAGQERIEDILYSKNYDMVLPIASLTKLMTAAVFLDTETPMDKVVTYEAGDNAIGSKLYVSPGETMTVKDLYYTMLVGSANNTANALARSTGLSREEFVQRMNDKAKVWGLEHTHFVDVSGLDPANVSTVYEVALMAKQALKDFRVLQGTTMSAYGFRTINTDKPHTIRNTAEEMKDSSLRITGMKTGYLDEAGYCFMFKARDNDDLSRDVITVVLGAGSNNQRYQETNELVNYALSRL